MTGVGVRTVFTPLEQKAWEGVVSQVRGKSGARQNCPFLAHGLLHFVLFGTVATVETRPATAKYYAAVKGAHIHVAEKGLLSLLQRQWDYAHNGRQVDMTRPASPTDDYYASYVPIANIETRLATMAASHGGWLVGTLSLSGCAVFTDKQNQQYQQTKKLPTDVQVPQGHVVVFQYVSPEHSKEGRIPRFMLFEPQSLVNGKLESPEARLVYDDISQAYPFLSAKRSEVEIGFDPYVSIVPFHSPSLAKGHLPENKRMKAEAAQGFFAQRADGELRVSPATEPVSIPIKMDPGSSPG